MSDATGVGLSTSIQNFAASKVLPFKNCRGQGYDGAGAMKGKFNGVQAVIRRTYPKAIYTHCSSHCLNLSLNDAATLCEIQQAIGVVKETCTFFRRSTVRSAALRQAFADDPTLPALELVSVCETRWVERHRAVMIFVEALEVVVTCLENLESEADDDTPSNEHVVNFPADA